MAPSRTRSGTTAVKASQTYSQKQKGAKCNKLEPVLEHCEAPSQKSGSGACGRRGESRPRKPLRMLMKQLRDGYVKLMNELAGADLSGMSTTFYACPAAGGVYPTRVAREEREQEVMIQALKEQATHSRRFTAAIA